MKCSSNHNLRHVRGSEKKKQKEQKSLRSLNVIKRTPRDSKTRETDSLDWPSFILSKPPVTYHGDVIVALNNLADFPHFLLHIARPDLTDYLTGICKCGWHVGRSGRELKPQQSCSVCGEGGDEGGGSVMKKDNPGREGEERHFKPRCNTGGRMNTNEDEARAKRLILSLCRKLLLFK